MSDRFEMALGVFVLFVLCSPEFRVGHDLVDKAQLFETPSSQGKQSASTHFVNGVDRVAFLGAR